MIVLTIVPAQIIIISCLLLQLVTIQICTVDSFQRTSSFVVVEYQQRQRQRHQQKWGITTTTTTANKAVTGNIIITTNGSRIQQRKRQQQNHNVQIRRTSICMNALSSNSFLENDLIAIIRPRSSSNDDNDTTGTINNNTATLCVINYEGDIIPLCRRLDDVETDLFPDPRVFQQQHYCQCNIKDDSITDNDLFIDTNNNNTLIWGEGFYGQRPVPSLGGGPGYGATADDVWSISYELLDYIRSNGIHIPIIDVGIAHGEKARGGSIS